MSERSSGIGFFGLLQLLFIGLKLGNVIDWSWWLVFLPIIGPMVLIILFIFIMFLRGYFYK